MRRGYEVVGQCCSKGHVVEVQRDMGGKYYILVDGRMTQKRLVSEEIVRYFLNAMEDN